MSKDLSYRMVSSSQITEEEIQGFLSVFNRVFKANNSREWFEWKYRQNMYGDSYFVLVEDGDRLVGIRGFWRNDVEEESYQPCDTAVLSEYRKLGIFSQSSKLALDKLAGYFIYNYPNQNSYPGYIKLGWKLRNHLYLGLALFSRQLEKSCPYIDDDYLNWRFIDCPSGEYFYSKKGASYYLLVRRAKNIYYVLGRFSGQYAGKFKKARLAILFTYSDKKTFSYRILKNRLNSVIYNNDKDVSLLPIYKADFF